MSGFFSGGKCFCEVRGAFWAGSQLLDLLSQSRSRLKVVGGHRGSCCDILKPPGACRGRRKAQRQEALIPLTFSVPRLRKGARKGAHRGNGQVLVLRRESLDVRVDTRRAAM